MFIKCLNLVSQEALIPDLEGFSRTQHGFHKAPGKVPGT